MEDDDDDDADEHGSARQVTTISRDYGYNVQCRVVHQQQQQRG